MNTIADFMSHDHQSCDNEFAIAEQAALEDNWDEAAPAFKTFNDDMERHFRTEEELLFPALASAGGPTGPVHIMRMEHGQIRDLLKQMAAAVASQDNQEYAGLSETLLMVMQQHNRKEENILYPIMDQILARDRENLMGRLLKV